jgi:hypothetical protein
MDDPHYDDVLIKGWEKNATTWLDIPLHPTGEMDVYDAITTLPNQQWLPPDRVRERLKHLQFQIFVNILLAAIFLRNVEVGIKTVKTRRRSIGAWCCLGASILGFSSGLVCIIMVLGGANCRQFIWYTMLTGSFATCSQSVAMLQQAYLALQSRRKIIVFGTICLLPQLTIGILAMKYSPITIDSYGSCVPHYSTALALCWFAAIAPINAFFLGVFSYITYLQYRKSGTLIWRRLARHGIQTMCFIILCNIGCGLCLVLQVVGNDSAVFFSIDL